nr:MAG TPA: Integrase [Bacteriophage sp.]
MEIKTEKYKQRADGRYSAQISTGRFNEKGKPIKITLYADTSKKLEKMVAEKKYELSHGMLSRDTSVTFGEYAKKWVDVAKANKTPSTQRMYKGVIKNHIGYLENIKLKDLTRSDIQMQINKISKYPKTCKILRMTIYQILDCAIDDGLIYKNVCKKIDLPVHIVKEKRALTEREKEAIKKADFTAREKAYLYLLYGCGLRPEEVRALTRMDFDFERNEVNINKVVAFDGNNPYPCDRTKTYSGLRTIPMPDETVKAVKNYLDILEGLLLFADENQKYKTKSSYLADWERIAKKINGDNKIERLTEYIFRHNYCTQLYYSGISIKECQRLMGHSDYSMIMKVYAHLDTKKENTHNKIRNII